MALVIRGRYKGQTVTLHQWAVNWFTVKEHAQVLSPLSLELNYEEIEQVLATKDKPGSIFNEYILDTMTGRFSKRHIQRNGRH